MQKKFSLMLIVTALSSFVPTYGVRTKSGAKKRKQHKLHVMQTEQKKSDDTPIAIDSNSEPVKSMLVPTMLDLDHRVIGLDSQKNATIYIPKTTTPDDKADTIASTVVVEDPKATELTSIDKKIIVLTGLKAFAASLSEKFYSIFR